MIDKAILDEVLPVPELETLKEEKIAELKEEGFAITNFHSGGVFYTLLLIVLRIKIEFTELLRAILNNMTLTHSTGAWLDIKAADYGKKRKKAQKAQGLVTLSRTNDQGEAVKIEKGHIFKTQKDINGEELRFFAIEAAVLQKGSRSVDVLVEAEKEGSRYNVPEGQITRSLTFLNGIDGISNGEDWIVREGSDTEDDEGLRTRALRSWSELAARSIEDTFINAAEAVQGVLFAQADCDHPRGQGTVDVIVTGTAGEATEGLLDEVRDAVNKIAGPYSIDRDLLKKILAKRFKKLKKKHPDMYGDLLRFYRLLCKVIDSSPEGERGIPLGNVSSQDFANIYLNELDQFCVRFLGAKLYTRYMDDIVIIAPSKEIAREWLAKIKEFLRVRLHLDTNKKTKVFYMRQGVNAYGFKIKATHLMIRTESKRREKRRIKAMVRKLREGKITRAAVVQAVNSWLGFARWASAYNLAKKIFAPYRFIKTEGAIPYGAISRNRQARRLLQQRRNPQAAHKAVA